MRDERKWLSRAQKLIRVSANSDSVAGLRFDGIKTALLANTWRSSSPSAEGGSNGSGLVPKELARHFNTIVESCQEGAVKPEPALFRAAVCVHACRCLVTPRSVSLSMLKEVNMPTGLVSTIAAAFNS